MKNIMGILVLVCAINSMNASGQHSTQKTELIIKNGDSLVVQLPDFSGHVNERFFYVDSLATFNGNLQEYLKTQTVVFKISESNKGQTVRVKFVVDADGQIHNITIASGKNAELDTLSISIIKNMPAWIPAKKDGQNVASPYMLVITY